MSSFADLITERLQPALAALLMAFDYAADSGADRWEFAVEMAELLAAGAALADFRWLILRNFAEHAKETTIPGDPHRSFRPLAPTSYPPDTCLVLTSTGAQSLRAIVVRHSSPSPSARREPVERTAKGQPVVSLPNGGEGACPSVLARSPDHAASPSPFLGEGRGEGAAVPNPQSLAPRPDSSPLPAVPSPHPSPQSRTPSPKPVWRSDLHELHFNGALVRRYKNPARNQELILAAFEEEGWPARIDDPLPPNGDLDPRQRLRNTIVTLNRHQLAPLLHFRCDGTGRGIQWELRRAANGSPLSMPAVS